jgi:tetratricopeptide (TPR) repeat protein
MTIYKIRTGSALFAAFFFLVAGSSAVTAAAQGSKSSSSSQSAYAQEKSPTLIDPAGPTISLISSEPVFVMAAALNACGYDEGLEDSAPVRKRVRDEIDRALARSEDARSRRDAICLYIAQHKMTGTVLDVSQYISLALYLTPPPELEMSADLTEMPPDATQVAEVVPILKAFVVATDLHGTWLTVHHTYDDEADKVHDSLSQMIVAANLYLKMPASTYDGRRFVVIIEPLLSPGTVNARIYGTDYVVVVSPQNGQIRMNDVRHTYLHYMIDPLLYARSNAIDRTNPVLKEIRDAPLEFRYRSDAVPLTIECLIKAIEARTMDTGVPIFKIPANIDRAELPRYEHERQESIQKADVVRWKAVLHDMSQGFVLTQYFYEQMIQFEKDPASLKDTIGELVYTMDVDQQVHRARNTIFDKEADQDVLQRSKPRKLTGLDLAEAKLAAGDVNTAAAMAREVLTTESDTIQSTADSARAHFILARVDLMTGHPDTAVDDFQKTLATTKEQRLLAWSHIYLGRMLDLECKRDEALAEYNQALATRDGQQDTRLAAERGVKTAYTVKGQGCDDADDNGAADSTAPGQPTGQAKGADGASQTAKPQ